MSYTVLARKYRSLKLDDIVGQDAIVTTLKNAINSGRLHHGYLFSGTRGVGKTSTARVLAKSLNCLSAPAPTVDPCCTCESCLSTAEGQDIDVVEIDAASNTGVDNIRDLRSNASYRPARARFKVYIVDEVHMLSAGAFNALLKTLEEPPAHVKFIFATTEQQKVPATIQSRVQRFEFQSIPAAVIAAQIRTVLAAEGVEADDEVVQRVARCARGSMRDGLSLLDQVMSVAGERLDAAAVEHILPPTHDQLLLELIANIARHEAAGALQTVDRYLGQGHTLERFCESLVEHVRTLMLLSVCGGETGLVELPAEVRDQFGEHSRAFDAQAYVYMIGVLENLHRACRASSLGRALADAAVVRLASMHHFSAIPELLGQLRAPTGRSGSQKKTPPATRVTAPGGAGRAASGADATAAGGAVAEDAGPNPGRKRAPNVSAQTINVARRDPLVKEALNRFDGQLFNVEPLIDGAEDRPSSRSPA